MWNDRKTNVVRVSPVSPREGAKKAIYIYIVKCLHDKSIDIKRDLYQSRKLTKVADVVEDNMFWNGEKGGRVKT